MINKLKKSYFTAGSCFTTGMIMAAEDAQAGTQFNDIAESVVTNIADLPGLLTGLCYLIGLILFALGCFKIKDHVENPGNTPLKDGAIRLAIGGALFAIPLVTDAMRELIGGDSGATVDVADVNAVDWNM